MKALGLQHEDFGRNFEIAGFLSLLIRFFENSKRNCEGKKQIRRKSLAHPHSSITHVRQLPKLAKTAQKFQAQCFQPWRNFSNFWLFLKRMYQDWQFLAWNLADFEILLLAYCKDRNEPKQKQGDKKSWGWGSSFWGPVVASGWPIVIKLVLEGLSWLGLHFRQKK